MIVPLDILGSIDWGALLSALAGVAGGGGVTSVLYSRYVRRTKAAEAKKAEGEASLEEVHVLREAIKEMGDNYKDLNADHDKDRVALAEKDGLIQELNTRLTQKSTVIATLSMLVCRNVGCSLREPVYGMGAKWFEEHSDDLSTALDHTPVNILLKKLGTRRKEEAVKTKPADELEADE